MSNTDSINKTTTISYKENLLFFEKVFASLHAAIFIIDLYQNKIIWSNDGIRKSNLSENTLSDEFLASDLQIYQGQHLGDLLREQFSLHPAGAFTTHIDLPVKNGKTSSVCLSCRIFRKTASVFEVACTAVEASVNQEPATPFAGSSTEKINSKNHQIISKLSKRELQLARFFAQGHPTKVIAEHFNLSVHTINNHRKNVLRKLGCRNIASFVYFAMKNGLN